MHGDGYVGEGWFDGSPTTRVCYESYAAGKYGSISLRVERAYGICDVYVCAARALTLTVALGTHSWHAVQGECMWWNGRL